MKSFFRASLVCVLLAAACACSSDITLRSREDAALMPAFGSAGRSAFAAGGSSAFGAEALAPVALAPVPPAASASAPGTQNAGGAAGTGAPSCPDGDGDGVCDVDDPCPEVAQDAAADVDRDGVPDACDRCGIAVALGLRPLFYFPLDEAEGATGAVNLGSVAQSAQYVGPVTRGLAGVADPDGRAVYLRGEQDGAFSSVTLLNVLEFPRTALTAMFWLRTSQTTTYAVLSYGLATSLNELGIIVEGDAIRVTLNSSAFIGTGLGSQALADGAWHHVAFSWQETSGQFYFDGLAAGPALATVAGAEETGGRSIPVTAPLVLRPGGVLVLGQEQDSLNGGFDVMQALLGGLDEVALYDRALTAAEVRAVFDATTCGERCDGSDNDNDGRTDEGLLGSGPQCAASSCQALADSGQAFGSGPYFLSSAPGQPTTCTF
jgi:hypothetical protein